MATYPKHRNLLSCICFIKFDFFCFQPLSNPDPASLLRDSHGNREILYSKFSLCSYFISSLILLFFCCQIHLQLYPVISRLFLINQLDRFASIVFLTFEDIKLM